ncbi:MAG: ABC-type transport auxiliary lipoprotein family protein [Sulfurimicrobium sp.]
MMWIRTVIIGLAWAALAGCASLQPVKHESANTFALEARITRGAAMPSPDAPNLVVSPARAWAGFDSPRMAYVRTPHKLEYFAKNQWIDSPARMLTPLLIQAAESSGAFGAVSAPGSGVAAQLRLESEIVRLQQEFTALPSRVRFTLRVQLIDVAARKVLATREFDVTENAPSEDPYGGVVAANRAVSRVLDEVKTFCLAQTKAPRP